MSGCDGLRAVMEASAASEYILDEVASRLSFGVEEVTGAATTFLSVSAFFCAAIFAFSYLALTSPPVHLVPKNRSQNVKNGWLKFVLIPQLW